MPVSRTIKIALLSDTHLNRSVDDPGPAQYRARFDKAIAQVRAAGVDFALIAGDLTEGGRPEEAEDFNAQAKALASPLRRVMNHGSRATSHGFPVWCVPGNHDVGDKRLDAKPGAGVTSARVADFEQRHGPSWWSHDYVRPVGALSPSASITRENLSAISDQQRPVVPAASSRHVDFKADGPKLGSKADSVSARPAQESEAAAVRVIGINASILGSALPEEAAQWSFLERELGRARPPRTLLLMHYPPFLSHPDEPSDPYWNVEPEPRARLLALAQRPRARVTAILSGHVHRPIESQLGRIRLITTPPISFGLPFGQQPEGWTLITVPSRGPIRTEFQPLM